LNKKIIQSTGLNPKEEIKLIPKEETKLIPKEKPPQKSKPFTNKNKNNLKRFRPTARKKT